MKDRTLKKTSILAIALSSLALSSCQIYLYVPSKETNDSFPVVGHESVSFAETENGDGTYTPDDFLPVTMKQMAYGFGEDLPATKGNVNVLVIPIEFSDSKFSSSFMSDLELALNGDGSSETGYWESASSFYKKSSFGKLNLHFTIANTYKPGMTTAQAMAANKGYKESEETEKSEGQQFVNDAVDYLAASNYPLTDFDSDNDGIIDSIVAVYSAMDYYHYYQKNGALPKYNYKGKTYEDQEFFWAYTYWCSNNGNLSSPKANTYVWLSYDFFYEQSGSRGVDPHTLIHEYGHAMGLDDYYAMEEKSDGTSFNPAGGIDMMDQNICDHDAYTKMALGWTVPKVVSGDDVTLTLSPSQTNGDCILVPSSFFNGSVWDEYILLELYTPTGLNELDSLHQYGTQPRGYTLPGVKLYHIDSRVIKTYALGNSRTSTTLGSSYVDDMSSLNLNNPDQEIYSVAATNSNKGYRKEIAGKNDYYSSDFSLIHLIESNGNNTFQKGAHGTNSSLFHAGDTFSMAKYGQAFFPNKTAMNSGDTFDYTIEFKSVTAEGAKIRFVKNA